MVPFMFGASRDSLTPAPPRAIMPMPNPDLIRRGQPVLLSGLALPHQRGMETRTT